MQKILKLSTTTVVFRIIAILLPWMLLAVLLCAFAPFAHAQKDALQKGNSAYEEDKYREALIYYNQIKEIEKSAPILFKRGVCYYEINQLDRAVIDFQRAYEYGYKNPQVDYYTGLVQHQKGNFELAAKYFKNYLRSTPIESGDRDRVRQLIRQCGQAIDLSYMRPLAIVERATKNINTVYDEIGLMESPTTSGRYYFSSNQPNTSLTMSASDFDIYMITMDNNEWSPASRLPYTINRRDEDILLGFTQAADGILFYRGKDYEGHLYLNSGEGTHNKTQQLALPATFNLASSDAFFYDDHLVIFSSNLSEGYGGLDLYASIKRDNIWNPPINLGPTINTSHDEVSPYLSKDGTELYFSSNRDESIGGLDIFYSSYLYEANRWNKPENLGIPINSPGDDVYFSLASDGLTAAFSSDRKNAIGGLDIYIARFKTPRGQQDYSTDYLPFVDYQLVSDEPLAHIDTSKNEFAFDPQDHKIYIEVSSEDITILEDNPSENTSVSNPLSTTDIENTTPQVPPIAYKVPTLYYSQGIDLSNTINQSILNQLESILLQHPGIKLEIQSHSSEEGILEYKLFSSIKLAEKIKKELLQKGIADRRIHVSGLADSYPLALSGSEGGDEIIANKFNNRIEFRFFDYNRSQLIFHSVPPDIPTHSISTRYELYRLLTEQSLNYKIQIAIVGQMYRGLALDLFNDATVEEDEDTGLYLYTIGLYDNYAEALQTKRDIERLGITDARVLPYYDGRLLSEDQLAYYVNQYPDLRNFMNYGN